MEPTPPNKIETQSVLRERDPSVLREKEPSIVKFKEHSQISERKMGKEGTDWNLKFLRNSSEGTIMQFQQAALSAFMAIWERDSNELGGKQRWYESEGLLVAASNVFSEEARLLKREFRNYHFILESCRDRWIVGVPLTCLIEWQGVVALVKAPLPHDCQEIELAAAIGDIRELERYTRVSNSVLERSNLWDATEAYGMNQEKRLIYLDRLIEYLPANVLEIDSKATLRPEYMLDTVSQVTPGGEVRPGNKQEFKALATVCEGLQGCIK